MFYELPHSAIQGAAEALNCFMEQSNAATATYFLLKSHEGWLCAQDV